VRNPALAIAAKPRRRHTSSSEQRRWVRVWERSDSTQEAFAQAHRLKLGTLRNWIRRHGTNVVPSWQKPGIEFREISLDQVLGSLPGGGRPVWEFEIRPPSGVVIAVAPGSSAARLRSEVVEAVRS
jgi:hypothetical protein